MSRVAVVGGGPAGMMAAATAARAGHAVTLFERNEKLGKKLYLTGKGRCNLTNAADRETFFENIPRNQSFLFSALHHFDNQAIVRLVNDMGVPTKVERGGRVFPASDKSSDVIRALASFLRDSGASVLLNARIDMIEHTDTIFTLHHNGRELGFDAVVLATGGMSYPSTGSTGDGYAFARVLGHTIVPTRPSLIPLDTVEQWPGTLRGLSLRNVTLSAFVQGKCAFCELGEMLFTDSGVSGPLVLSASSRIADAPEGVELTIDLKPALNLEELDRRVLRDFGENPRRVFENALGALLPRRLIAVAVELSGIAPQTPVHAIKREERLGFSRLLKRLPLTVRRAQPIELAVVTRGGVNVKEINASTMESKLVKNLYFAGELIDVDAYTGGFNLQIAYSTGALAGRSIR